MSAPIPNAPDVPAIPGTASLPGGVSQGGDDFDADASFTSPELNANPCEFSFKLPSFAFPPFDLPIPHFKLTLTCDLSAPINISAGIEPGGGRSSNNDPSPDDDDSF